MLASGEDGFSINSVAEVAAGRDIRLKIATLGQTDITSGKIVGSQPFKEGVLFRSLTGISWEPDQSSDLKFTATFNLYPENTEQIVYLQSLSISNGTAFICNWESTKPKDTRIVFEFRTQSGTWTEFTPFQLTCLNEVASTLYFRAKLSTTNENISPYVKPVASIYVQSHATTLDTVTRNFEVGSTCDTCDIFLDSHLPGGSSQAIRVSFDDGVSWVDLTNPVDGSIPDDGNLVEYSPVDLNAINIKYRHHWQVALIAPNVLDQVRVDISCSTSGGNARLAKPRFSRLIAIASDS